MLELFILIIIGVGVLVLDYTELTSYERKKMHKKAKKLTTEKSKK